MNENSMCEKILCVLSKINEIKLGRTLKLEVDLLEIVFNKKYYTNKRKNKIIYLETSLRNLYNSSY